MFKIDIKEIHIFDIDGCIFPAKNNDGIQIMPNNFIEISSKNIINKMKHTDLFPKFIDFYKLITKGIKNIDIYFITGRKKRDYLNITLKQLSVLNTKKNRDNLIFFSDDKLLTKRSYYEFKIYNTLKIIIGDGFTSKINIYDDNTSYFSILKNRLSIVELNNINYNEVKEPEYFWNLKNEEYKNLIKITQKHLKMIRK